MRVAEACPARPAVRVRAVAALHGDGQGLGTGVEGKKIHEAGMGRCARGAQHPQDTRTLSVRSGSEDGRSGVDYPWTRR